MEKPSERDGKAIMRNFEAAGSPCAKGLIRKAGLARVIRQEEQAGLCFGILVDDPVDQEEIRKLLFLLRVSNLQDQADLIVDPGQQGSG